MCPNIEYPIFPHLFISRKKIRINTPQENYPTIVPSNSRPKISNTIKTGIKIRSPKTSAQDKNNPEVFGI